MAPQLVSPQTRSAPIHFPGDPHAEKASHSPRLNHLLAMLPEDEYERLVPALELVALPRGWCLHSAGDRHKYLYFPVSGVVARIHELEDGSQAGFSLVGSDGVVGLASFLGGDSSPGSAVAVAVGYAYRMRVEVLRQEFERFSALARVLLCYTQGLMMQVMQTCVCNRFHSVDQQLCRFVLSCLDRLPSGHLDLTQERIAELIGVRREGITEAAGRLEAAGLVRLSRGHISVLDRAGIEARACECYAAVKRECERLLPDRLLSGDTT